MDLATDNSAATGADNLATEPANDANGTGTTTGQAPGATPGDDLFKGVDPNRLSPELKQSYDSMLRDYREKTTKLSETTKSEVQKATEAYRQKAEHYDQIAREESFVKQWNEYVQKAQSVQANGQEANSNPELAQMKATLNEMTQKIQMSELSQVTDSFAEAVNEKGEKMHPDFDQLNGMSIGQLNSNGKQENFSLLRACIELSTGKTPQERLANGYKSAKALRDSIFDEGKKAGMGRLQQKIQNGSLPPSNAAGEVLSVTDKRPKTAHEALAMARRGQVVSRD